MNEAIAKLPWTDRQWDMVQQAVKQEAERTRVAAKLLRAAKADPKDVAVPAYALGNAGLRLASNRAGDAALRAAFSAAAISGAAVAAAAGVGALPAVAAAAGTAAAAAAAAGAAPAEVARAGVAAATAAATAAGVANPVAAGQAAGAAAAPAAVAAAAAAGANAATAAADAAAARSQRTDVDSDPTVYLSSISRTVYLRNRELADADLEAALTYFRRAGAEIAQAENALLLNGRTAAAIRGAPAGVTVNGIPNAARGLLDPQDAPNIQVPAPAAAAVGAAGGGFAAFGGQLARAVSDATAQLEAVPYHGPYAMVASTLIWRVLNQPAAQSLVPARPAIERTLLGGPLLQSGLLPAGWAIVVPHDSPELEQVVARDIGVKFLQMSEEPRAIFRVSVRTALRVRDRNAIATIRLF